jgi:hypothetical protein
MLQGLFQSLAIISISLIARLTGIHMSGYILLLHPFVLISICYIELHNSNYSKYIKYESIVIGFISLLVFLMDIQLRIYLYVVTFYFLCKPAYIFSRNITDKCDHIIYNICNIFLYILPFFYFHIYQKKSM